MKHTEPVIPEKPEIEYDQSAAEEILVCAESYLRQADHLIYSYGSRTFLSGYHIFDEEYEYIHYNVLEFLKENNMMNKLQELNSSSIEKYLNNQISINDN